MIDYDDWGNKPLPVIDPDSEEYWAAAAEDDLVVQRCTTCGERQFYPRQLCRHCWSDALEFESVAGTGAVYSYSRCHIPGQPGYGEETPYTVVLVELDLPETNPSDRAVRLVTHVVADSEEISVGDSVAVKFVKIGEGENRALPVFELET